MTLTSYSKKVRTIKQIKRETLDIRMSKSFGRKTLFDYVKNFLEAYSNAFTLPEDELHIDDNKNLITREKSQERINLILGVILHVTGL